jgi:DNA sulfur modification protein DndE
MPTSKAKMIESIKLTETEREMLIRIKRKSGIESWNVLCRWAYLLGLAEKNLGINAFHEKRDAVEIKWETFTGKNFCIYNAITKLQYSVEISHEEGVAFFEFIHSKLSAGIRILSRSATENNLLCFVRQLDLSS